MMDHDAEYAERLRDYALEDVDHEDHYDAPSEGAGWREGDPCQVCGEDEDDPTNDPLAHFWNDQRSAYVMCHGQCGEDAGLRLA